MQPDFWVTNVRPACNDIDLAAYKSIIGVRGARCKFADRPGFSNMGVLLLMPSLIGSPRENALPPTCKNTPICSRAIV
jgi:hypothetical protein